MGKRKKYDKALRKIADLLWEMAGPGGRDDYEAVYEEIAEIIDRTDRTLWDKP